MRIFSLPRLFILTVAHLSVGFTVLADEPKLPKLPAPPVMNHEASSVTVNVKQQGALGDGIADDTKAIQSALDGGRRTVFIPAGTYRISHTLQLDSGTTLLVDPHAVIRLADHAGNDVGLFLLANRDFAAGNTDIIVDGGIWDGNNENNPRGQKAGMPCYSGVAINFINMHRLILRNLTVRNPDAYAIRACRLEDFTIENIGFDFRVTRMNQDGVHLDGFCQRGLIRNLRAVSPFATNDDMVALNADDGSPADYVIQQSMVQGPIRDITVEHLAAESTFTFVRMLSNHAPIENISVRDISGGCRFYAINMDRWRFPAGGGNIHNVTLRDIHVRKMPDTFSSQPHANDRPLIHIQSAVHGLRIESFLRATDDVPAATLILDNGRKNQLRLEGLTAAQQAELQKLSPSVTPEMFGPVAGGTNADARVLQMDASGVVTLPAGGFFRLSLDSDPSASEADAARPGAK